MSVLLDNDKYLTESDYERIKHFSDKELRRWIRTVNRDTKGKELTKSGTCLLEALQALKEVRANGDYV